MSKNDKKVEDLTVEELRILLAQKKRQSRQARLEEFRRTGRALRLEGESEAQAEDAPSSSPETGFEVDVVHDPPAPRRAWANRLLLVVEIAAVLGFLFIIGMGLDALRSLNQEVSAVLGGSEPTPTALITAVVLPSGHTPPTSPGGAQFNEAEIPEGLRPLVQSISSVAIPTAGPQQARSIYIPRLWNSPAPVVMGDGWEQLKRGVGQHIGSTNPGQNGNLVLSAHNDIFGELFRDLDRLQPGDEIIIQTATQQFIYIVDRTIIVEPTDVEVMDPTENATITLISCYPYLVDDQRIVVFGVLADL
jgi:sortase A